MQLSLLARHVSLEAVCALLDGGWMDLYDGSPPSSDLQSTNDHQRLASLRFGSLAFAAPANGIANAHPIQPDTDATGGGTASWYRLTQADHETPIADGTVGIEGADLNLRAVEIPSHVEVRIEAFVLVAP